MSDQNDGSWGCLFLALVVWFSWLLMVVGGECKQINRGLQSIGAAMNIYHTTEGWK